MVLKEPAIAILEILLIILADPVFGRSGRSGMADCRWPLASRIEWIKEKT